MSSAELDMLVDDNEEDKYHDIDEIKSIKALKLEAMCIQKMIESDKIDREIGQ